MNGNNNNNGNLTDAELGARVRSATTPNEKLALIALILGVEATTSNDPNGLVRLFERLLTPSPENERTSEEIYNEKVTGLINATMDGFGKVFNAVVGFLGPSGVLFVFLLLMMSDFLIRLISEYYDNKML